MDYNHYHVKIMAEEGLMELTVSQVKNKHIVEYWWGSITGTSDNPLGRFDNVKDAVKFAVMILKEMYDGYIVRGAGCPPDKLLNQVEKELREIL